MFHVEQFGINKNLEQYIRLLLCLFGLAFTLTGCSSVDPNPELKDPIYLDLSQTIEETHELMGNADMFREMAKDELKTLETGDPEIATLNKDIHRETLKIQAYKQKIRYLEIRKERRRLESRLAYARSLESEATWPDQKEYAAYQAHKKLRNASSNWNERVPRLKERIDHYTRKMNGEPEPARKGDPQ